ncbi:MAG: hypothetical protein CM1200mP14_03380 [Gammaproteobacteria bacterium]|nr:MAG: hypothetical protein CM1200mP14_03380 [Gammaproteobacteria bacterium]
MGGTLDADMIDGLAERAHEQCHPLENLIVDAAGDVRWYLYT